MSNDTYGRGLYVAVGVPFAQFPTNALIGQMAVDDLDPPTVYKRIAGSWVPYSRNGARIVALNNTIAGESKVGTSDAFLGTLPRARLTVVTGNTVVSPDPIYLLGIFVSVAGTQINLYDNDAGATGNLYPMPTTALGPNTLNCGVPMNTGCYATLTGAGTVFVLWWPQ